MAFPNNCNTRVITVSSSKGCTLTRASLGGMTPQLFENQGNTEVKMDRIIANSAMARTIGVKENTLEMLLMGTIKPLKKTELARRNVQNESLILPYIYRRQDKNVNMNGWRVTTGAATPGAGSGGVHPGAWNLTLATHAGAFATALPNLYQFFLPGSYLLVETLNTTTRVSQSLQYKIINSVASGSNAVVTVEPNYSVSGWNALTSTQKAVYQPIVGSAIILSNSVSNYESYGQQYPALNNRALRVSWLQTTRKVHEYSDEYLRALQAGLTSEYYQQFLQLPIVKQKQQQEIQWRRDWFNSLFYGQRINENQDVETYASLPTVEDPNNPGCVLEYKANALGFKQQLLDCGRVSDLQGAALSMDSLFSVGYGLKRAREADDGEVSVIDAITNRFTAGQLHAQFINFYKALGYPSPERFYQLNQKMKFDDQIEFNYNIYDVPPQYGGYQLAIFWHPYFDDKLSTFDTAIASRGASLFMIDWSDLMIGIAQTMTVKRETNVMDALFQYVMKPNLRHVIMDSTTWTAVLDDQNRHYIFDNFDANACPTVTVAGCDVSAP